MSQNLDYYVKRLAKLRRDAAGKWPSITLGKAPHKPLLLLAIFDLFAESNITSNFIEITPDLGELFTRYWKQVMPPDQRGNLALPFYHLHKEKDSFWHLLPKPGEDAFLTNSVKVDSVSLLREKTFGARLDDDLFQLLCVEASRNVLRTVLIDSQFAKEAHIPLVDQGQINIEAFQYSQQLLEQARTLQFQQDLHSSTPQPQAVRDQAFRRAVVAAYNHYCAMCRIRILTSDGHTSVEAAHIIPWSVSHNDDPRNGISLCQLCHWMFDEGIMSLSSHYTIVISPQLSANGNIPGQLLTLKDRTIVYPVEQALWPDVDAINWHRHTIFRRL